MMIKNPGLRRVMPPKLIGFFNIILFWRKEYV